MQWSREGSPPLLFSSFLSEGIVTHVSHRVSLQVIRLLIVQRRDYPLAVKRKAFLKRGGDYTDLGRFTLPLVMIEYSSSSGLTSFSFPRYFDTVLPSRPDVTNCDSSLFGRRKLHAAIPFKKKRIFHSRCFASENLR
jgi:hypothetical protein